MAISSRFAERLVKREITVASPNSA
jgi:hypothetical protein